MEFVSALGPTAIVDERGAGQRLQSFACRAFREQLGRNEHTLHGACKQAAHNEIAAKRVLVNGKAGEGRHVMTVGDVVTLVMDRKTGHATSGVPLHDPEHGCSNVRDGRARMTYSPGESIGAASHVPAQSRGARTFAAYYTAQNICPESEWPSLEAGFARPLPLCLRLNRSMPSHKYSLRDLRGLFGHRLEHIPWALVAWRLHSKESAELGDSQDVRARLAEEAEAEAAGATTLLMEAQLCGELALQEAAAMLPALALQPASSHFVLDLCAAPGGKTLQLLDMMMAAAPPSSRAVEGFLVSNDLQRERQVRTLRRGHCQPCAPLMVTHADATKFRLWTRTSPASRTPILFDRVLCDVPCGGDGTLRKSPAVWSRWNTRTGLRNHALQVAILRNGLASLKLGGVLVYSTCSLDPIQNEAVVNAVMASDPSLRLLSREEALPEETWRALNCDPGLRTWRVPHPEFDGETNAQLFVNWEEVPARLRSGEVLAVAAEGETGGHRECGGEARLAGQGPEDDVEECLLLPSMFPRLHRGPAGSGAALEHCMRLLPKHDDVGGFFVAVLRREAASTQVGMSVDGSADGSADARSTSLWLRQPCAEVATELASFFGLKEDCLMRLATVSVGADGQPSLLSLVPPAALNLETPLPDNASLVGVGLPLFCKMPSGAGWWPPKAPWRVCQEGAAFLCAMGARRVLRCSTPEVARRVLCARRTPLVELRALFGRSLYLFDRRVDMKADGGTHEPEPLILEPGAAILSVDCLGVEEVHAIAALLDEEGLLLLASEDLLRCYARRCGSDVG